MDITLQVLILLMLKTVTYSIQINSSESLMEFIKYFGLRHI